MDLSKYKLLHHDPDQFVVHDGEKSFAIAKKLIGKPLTKKIEEHFAIGGEVETPEAAAIRESVEAPGSFVPGQITPVDTGPDIDQRAAATATALGQPYSDAGRLTLPMATPGSGTAGATEIPGTPALATPPTAAVQPDAAAVQAPQAGAPGGIPGLDKEIKASFAGQSKAAGDLAKIQGAEADSSAQVQNAYIKKRDEATQKAVTDNQAWQARADQMFQDIASSKIDPNHLWHSASTGQKMSATIGMILGGIGAGLTGGPNQATQIIESAINRDMESQKANLGKKESLLSYHLQQGHSMREAQQMALADMKDMAAAQLAANATKFGGPKAAALAEAEQAKLRGSAALTRQEVAGKNLDMKVKGLQVEATQQAMQTQKQQQAAVSALGNATAQTATSMQGMGAKLPPQTLTALSMNKEIGPRLVTLPNGNTALAKTEDDAKSLKTLQEKTTHYQQLVREMADLQKNHPNGISTLLSPAEYARAEKIRADATATGGEIANLQRLTGEEVKLYEKGIPDLNSFTLRPAAAKAKLDEIQKEIDTRNLAAFKQRLIGG